MNIPLQQTKASVATDPSTIGIPNIFGENLRVWEEPHVTFDRFISNSWIAGSSTNAIVGTWTGTAGGGQLVVGDTTNTQVLLRVVPANDVWINFLRDTYTNTSGYGLNTNTGALDTATFRVDLDSAEVISWRIAYGSSSYRGVIPFFSEDAERTNFTFGTNGIIEYSTDNSNWVAAPNKTATYFTSSSTVYIRLRSTAASKYWQTADGNGYEVPLIVRLIAA